MQTYPNETRPETTPKNYVWVLPDGQIRFIYTDAMAQLLTRHFKTVVTRRASHVEPDENGQWYVDVSPILKEDRPRVISVSSRRDEALRSERDWLEKHFNGLGNHKPMAVPPL